MDWHTLTQALADVVDAGLPAAVGLVAYVVARLATRWAMRPPSDLAELARDVEHAAAEAARLARAAEGATRSGSDALREPTEPTGPMEVVR